MRFQDKVAIVTGGASGIGFATAKRFSCEGAKVVIAGLHADKSQHAAEKINSSGGQNAIGIGCDVSCEADVVRTVDETIQKFGQLDIIVNNAGTMIFKPLEEESEQDWRKVLDTDLLGAFYFIKQAFLRMKNGGTIVNISSVHAFETTPLVSAYAAAKAALVSLTRSASLEGRSRKIRVNSILPGAVDTPMLWNNPNVKSGLEKIDRGMLGTPEEIAAVITFLASSESAFIEGAAVSVDGGRLGKL
jgi:NAD(P)-dependent dehydrogenase (short-subunit alcohol dehydrogenase family)